MLNKSKYLCADLTSDPVRVPCYLQQVVYHKKHPKARVYLLDADFNTFVANSINNLPTLGYLGIMLALHRCAKVG